MRKITALLLALIVFVVPFTGCKKNEAEADVPESPVTLEQIHSDGQYAARAYCESLLYGDKEKFYACYPDGFIDSLNNVTGVDVYEEYRNVLNISGEFLGTRYADSKDYILQNGYDDYYMRQRIINVTGLADGDVGLIKVEKIKLYFIYGEENVETYFYVVVYEAQGSWYVLETISAQDF